MLNVNINFMFTPPAALDRRCILNFCLEPLNIYCNGWAMHTFSYMDPVGRYHVKVKKVIFATSDVLRIRIRFKLLDILVYLVIVEFIIFQRSFLSPPITMAPRSKA
jgi:hypothetical protein